MPFEHPAEYCTSCGGYGGAHASSCPRLKTDGLAGHRGVEAPPGFTLGEVHQLVGIVDRRSPYEQDLLDRVTRENVGSLIEIELRRNADLRKDRNLEDMEGKAPSQLVDLIFLRGSGSHAFQCSANKAEDYGETHDRLLRFAAENGIAEDDEDLRTMDAFLRRQEKMNDLMTRLFEKDVARRIGDLKGDQGYFEDAMADFGELADEIAASLEEYESDDAEGIATNPDVRAQIDVLRARLETAKASAPSAVAPGFYGDIVMLYSTLIFEDTELFNEEKVTGAAANLDRKGKV